MRTVPRMVERALAETSGRTLWTISGVLASRRDEAGRDGAIAGATKEVFDETFGEDEGAEFAAAEFLDGGGAEVTGDVEAAPSFDEGLVGAELDVGGGVLMAGADEYSGDAAVEALEFGEEELRERRIRRGMRRPRRTMAAATLTRTSLLERAETGV